MRVFNRAFNVHSHLATHVSLLGSCIFVWLPGKFRIRKLAIYSEFPAVESLQMLTLNSGLCISDVDQIISESSLAWQIFHTEKVSTAVYNQSQLHF